MFQDWNIYNFHRRINPRSNQLAEDLLHSPSRDKISSQLGRSSGSAQQSTTQNEKNIYNE